jgi:hypothetical protein
MVWRELFLEEQRGWLARMLSPKDVMTQVLKMEETMQMKIAILLWLWWTERNAAREGECRRTASDLDFVVHNMSEEFLALHKQSLGRQPGRAQHWCNLLLPG